MSKSREPKIVWLSAAPGCKGSIMDKTNSACVTRVTDSSVVLLARIVDGAGRPILPSQVMAIEYSAFECDSCPMKHFAPGTERPATRLVVSDVLLPMLVNDELWSVDVAGYNFRHQVAIGEGIATPTTGGHVELRYVFSGYDNIKEIIRFHLKVA
jgi:hypothetical protein